MDNLIKNKILFRKLLKKLNNKKIKLNKKLFSNLCLKAQGKNNYKL